MTFHRHWSAGFCALVIASFTMACGGPLHAQQKAALSIGPDAIGGQVTGANGPEAGVWVIAETTDLPTKFAKMVVTNDAGQFVIPQLPAAKYKIWVRGYGLVDSDKQDVVPGKTIDLTAKPAPNALPTKAVEKPDASPKAVAATTIARNACSSRTWVSVMRAMREASSRSAWTSGMPDIAVR